MKLTVKMVSAFMLVVILLASLGCYLAVRREVRRFDAKVHKTVREVGSILERMVVVRFRDNQPETVAQLIRSFDDGYQELKIRWVKFDASADDPQHSDIPYETLQSSHDHSKLKVEVADYDADGLVDHFWIIPVDDETRSGLEMSHSTDELRKATREAILDEVLQTVSLLVVAGLALTMIGIRRIGRPLNQLIEKTRQIGQGDLSHPVHIQTNDELAQLGDALNNMCAQLEDSQESIRAEAAARIAAIEQLRHAERLQMIGRFASGIAHELGTPLNVVSGRAGLIESGKLSSEETQASASIIKSQADRISDIVRQLLDFARRKPTQKLPVDLRTIVSQTVGLVASMVEKANVSMVVAEAVDPVMALVDATQIQQVLNNLIANAAQAMPDGGRIDVSFDRQMTRPPDAPDADKREYLCIRVRDQGEGIADDDRQHIFEPFFTTKTVGQGTGLGLSISYGIAQEHGGWIDVETVEGTGSCFSVYLPGLPPSQGPSPESTS